MRSVPSLVVAIVVLAVGAAGAVGCSSSDEDGATTTTECPGPTLSVVGSGPAADEEGDTPTIPLGSVTVSGARFADGCGSDAEPLQGVRLFVVQGSERISIAQVNADSEQAFGVVVGLPEAIESGPAEIVAQASLEPDAEVLASTDLVISDG